MSQEMRRRRWSRIGHVLWKDKKKKNPVLKPSDGHLVGEGEEAAMKPRGGKWWTLSEMQQDWTHGTQNVVELQAEQNGGKIFELYVPRGTERSKTKIIRVYNILPNRRHRPITLYYEWLNQISQRAIQANYLFGLLTPTGKEIHLGHIVEVSSKQMADKLKAFRQS